MLTASILVAALVGGLVAGVVALTVGGLGVLLLFRRQLADTQDAVVETQRQLEREVKRRAGDARQVAPGSGGLGPLAALKTVPPLQDDENLTREEIVRRFGGR